jgi:hypothetical protein
LLAGNAVSLPFGFHRFGVLALGTALAVGLTVVVWPELAVPAIVIGAGLLDMQFGGYRVRHLVFVKLALFACACVGVAFANLRGQRRFTRVRTPADIPAFMLVCYTAISAAYGYLVAGHRPDSVAVAGYHLSQFGIYHFLMTTTLCRPESLRRAGLIVLLWSLVWLTPSILAPGRGGGAASTWLIVLLCYGTSQRSWWTAVAWALLPLALLDTLTSGYRTLWVGLAGQLTWLAAIGIRGRVRWLGGAAPLLLVIGVVMGYLVLVNPSLLAPIPAAETLQRFRPSVGGGGYRIPEALIGISTFMASPIVGRGVGYQTPVVWVETMGYMSVGPIHHLYYVSYLSNEGVIGLAIVLWYFAAVLFARSARRVRRRTAQNQWAGAAAGLQAALFGAILGGFLSGPTDGYWTWGVFGAGALLTAVFAGGTAAAADDAASRDSAALAGQRCSRRGYAAGVSHGR